MFVGGGEFKKQKEKNSRENQRNHIPTEIIREDKIMK